MAMAGNIAACSTPGIRKSAASRYRTGNASERIRGFSFIDEPTTSTAAAGRNIERYRRPMTGLLYPHVSPTMRLSVMDKA
jgi:hypothetical protein